MMLRSNLESIGAFIAQDSPRAAARVVTRIRAAAELLESMPEIGRKVRGRPYRERVVTRLPYLLVYEIVGDEVHILGVVHQSRDRA